MRPFSSCRALCALLLFTPACVSLEDIPLAKDGGEQSVEEDAEAGELPPPDAEVDADSEEPPPETDGEGGEAWIDPDSGIDAPTLDASIDGGHEPGRSVENPPSSRDAGIFCAIDSDCSQDQICMREEKTCVARCDPDLGCPILEVDLVHASFWGTGPEAISDGLDTFYYLTEMKVDLFGNPVGGIHLWKLPLEGRPSVVSDNVGTTITDLLFVSPDHIYFRNGNDELKRIAKQGGQPEVLDTGVLAAWRDANNVWWSKTVPTGSELYRSPLSGTVSAARVASAIHSGWVTGNAAWVVRAVDTQQQYQPLIVELLPDLTSSRQLGDVHYAGEIVADDVAIYLSKGGAPVQRYWPDPQQGTASLSLPMPNFQVSRGGWVYWLARASWDHFSPHVLGRGHRDKPAEGGELLRTTMPIEGFAALPHAVMYLAAHHLYVKRTPLPCAVDLPCPGGFSCSVDECK